jgi:pSer/pThr/pTyr-binding forkhead associated (FHA) protein
MSSIDRADAYLFVEYVSTPLDVVIHKSQAFKLPADRYLIGRMVDCHLCLSHGAVSRYHAEIVCSDRRYYVVDLDSRNGTLLNGAKMEAHKRYALKSNDQIQIADLLILQFEDPSVTTVVTSPKPFLTERIWLDAGEGRLFVLRREVDPPLTKLEFRMLQVLYERRGQTVARDEIAAAVWTDDLGDISEDMIYNIISRLKERLSAYDNNHKYIKTKRGIGYMFVLPGTK